MYLGLFFAMDGLGLMLFEILDCYLFMSS